jgi:hypothetical protein
LSATVEHIDDHGIGLTLTGADGAPLPGVHVAVVDPRTEKPVATYIDPDFKTRQTAPIVTDAHGRPPRIYVPKAHNFDLQFTGPKGQDAGRFPLHPRRRKAPLNG